MLELTAKLADRSISRNGSRGLPAHAYNAKKQQTITVKERVCLSKAQRHFRQGQNKVGGMNREATSK